MALLPYIGNPLGPGSAGFNGTLMEPDDGDPWTMAEFNPAYELLMDDCAFLNATAFFPVAVVGFTVAGTYTWTAPAGCIGIWVVGCGGGGGGEAGIVGSLTTTLQVQGGGGAGAPFGSSYLQVVPGQVYTIVVGAGGAAGTAPGGGGADGAATTFSNAVPHLILEFRGAAGCGIDQDVVATGLGSSLTLPPSGMTPTTIIAPGATGLQGRPRLFPHDNGDVRVMQKWPASTSATIIDNQRYTPREDRAGGSAMLTADIDSTYTNFPQGASTGGRPGHVWTGAGLIAGGFSGGNAGNLGANHSGPFFGGSGGGGGGGGPFGPGGDGGNGGNANAVTGANGSAGQAGTGGGGGGGGGSGGGGSTTGGNGANAGAGGDGAFFILAIRNST